MAKSKVLVVDDNLDAARSMAAVIRIFGHNVQVVHDGQAAIRAASRNRPDLIILDIGLPGMNGFEVAKTLRENPSLQGVRIVAVTGWGQEPDLQRSKEVGIDLHVVKPIDPALLEKILRELQPQAPESGAIEKDNER